MDWEAIHHYAEEIELWSSLVLNVWALSTAVVIAIKWLAGRALTAASLAHSAKVGISILTLAIGMLVSFSGTALGPMMLQLFKQLLTIH